ncbi:hypothetical protein [Bacillus mycoides]|uniref:hypothetical protein n=1 Tax=Bacillus mycoides TaxID=1405 RepID=UPI003D1A4841
MNKKRQLIQQVKVVIHKLEKDYVKDINSGILQLIYKTYNKALEILENNEDIKGITIVGGVRAYMDSHNDYPHTLLEELYKAETITKELTNR